MMPLALKLTNRPVLVIGAGRVGSAKARLLIESGARVTMIAKRRVSPLPEGLAHLELRPYRSGDLEGHTLVVSATGDATMNDRLVHEARELGVWINVVDDPIRSDFFFTAVHRSGDVIVSVSTQGASPALAQAIRSRIKDALPENLGDIAQRLREQRHRLHASGASTESVDWNPLIGELFAERPIEERT